MLQLLPTMEGFDPEAYLAVFHENTSANELAIGAQTLERELGEGAGQLKQLVSRRLCKLLRRLLLAQSEWLGRRY
jgi:hypothetical protein